MTRHDQTVSITSCAEALSAVEYAWPTIVDECRAVLGGELHYQAVIYHCLRKAGVPRDQVGMNVKQWLASPISAEFQTRNLRKHERFRGGFETISDITIFSTEVKADWRRRNFSATARHALLAIEVKASERAGSRLTEGEIRRDIEKIAPHRDKILHIGGTMHPVMMVIDVAPDARERMAASRLAACLELGEASGVSVFYASLDESRVHSKLSIGTATVTPRVP